MEDGTYKEKLQSELNCLEKLGVISPIEESTDWGQV